MAVDSPAGRPGFRPAHPGRILRRNLEALDMTQDALARHIGLSRQTVSALIAGRAAVSPDVAARLGKAFGTSSGVWINLQSKHDAWEAERTPAVRRITKIAVRRGTKAAAAT